MSSVLDSKVLIFILSTVFFAGGGWMSVQASMSDVASLNGRVEAVIENHNAHTSSPGHDSTKFEVDAMQARLMRLEVSVAKLQENQQQMAINLGAICLATGAHCK